METSWAVGFNALGLAEEEESLLPSGSSENIYVEVSPLYAFESSEAVICCFKKLKSRCVAMQCIPIACRRHEVIFSSTRNCTECPECCVSVQVRNHVLTRWRENVGR